MFEFLQYDCMSQLLWCHYCNVYSSADSTDSLINISASNMHCSAYKYCVVRSNIKTSHLPVIFFLDKTELDLFFFGLFLLKLMILRFFVIDTIVKQVRSCMTLGMSREATTKLSITHRLKIIWRPILCWSITLDVIGNKIN